MTTSPLLLRPFQPSDQAACRDLILSGLAEHWGWLDPTLNSDLNDIRSSYAPGFFLTAWQETELVGTGALLPAGEGCFQVVRMSVARDQRGQGIGRRILACLEEHARAARASRLILETTETWEGVTRFYLNCAYRFTHRKDGDIYFEKDLFPLI